MSETIEFHLGFFLSSSFSSSVLVTLFVPNSIMGCGPSKVDDLPLVTLCKKRKELIKAALIHRSALAAAHVTYFHSLRDVGEAIRKFVDEELVVGSSSSAADSPVLSLPSDEFKSSKINKTKDDNHLPSSSSTSLSHSFEENTKHPKKDREESDGDDSHLDLSSGSPSISGSGPGSPSGHVHMDHSHSHSPEQEGAAPYGYNYGYGGYGNGYGHGGYPYPPHSQENWGYNGNSTSYMYYMKKSATPSQSFVYQEPEGHSSNGYSSYQNGGSFGYPLGSPRGEYGYGQRNSPPAPPQPPPAPPSPPRNSTWDFLNVFDSFDNSGYPGYYPAGRYGYGSSSPDSKEVREREGIPDLEDETEPEMLRAAHKEKKKIMNEEVNHNYNNISHNSRNFGEGTSKSVPVQKVNITADGPTSASKTMPASKSESLESGGHVNIDTSSGIADTIVTKSSEEEFTKNKRVSFEIEEVSNLDVESSKPSSLTTLSVHGTRDLQEVVKEIKDEFETASSYGKEVAVLLEVGQLPYQPRKGTRFRVIFSRILYLVAPNMSHTPPRSSIQITSRTMKMAKEYCQVAEPDEKPRNLSSTLEELYAWEKKLYKEVKEEERLRVIYEKKCKRLRMLDSQGAEASKIDATRASIRKLLTKINVCIKAVETISSRIHKLRDEELQPQLTELVHGLIRMWKSMLSCHQKQFQAIMESKVRFLRANTSFQRESGLKATLELEMELLGWCTRFNNWINSQKAYVGSLYEWLMRCIEREQEITADGVAPFSPGRIGAPTIFVICNDWYQAMDRVSEKSVANAMHSFASGLHQLWERQDEEQRLRTRAQHLSKDFEKRLRELRIERQRIEQEQDALSDKTAVSKVPAGTGVSPLDDLKVDLDSMRKKLEEERARHKDAIKLVHEAASSSLQGGLVPIFEALGNFTLEVLKAHEQVRLENAGVS